MPGRYTILGTLAKGGMATVYLGRIMGSAGFSRLVAIKRLHPELAAERQFVAMLVDEARLASQIRHANVVDTLDLVVSDGAFSLVLDYVEGDSLSALVRRARDLGEGVPRPIALAILYGVLRGLDAAHDARNEEGGPLGIVHRDVSPQNVLLGVDGIPRVIDFGVAKAIGRFDSTRPGEIRGKFSYMSPEQMAARPVTRQVDVYAAGVVLWELLAGRKLFAADDSRAICAAVLGGDIKPPSAVNADVSRELDAVVLRATARELGDRYLTAREFLSDLEKFETASDDEVGAWVRRLCAKELAECQRMLQGALAPTDGRPIDELMKDLALGGDVPESGALPVSREIGARGPMVAARSGSGVELAPAGEGASGAPLDRNRRSIFVVALAIVAALVLVGVFVRVRPGASRIAAAASPSASALSDPLDVAPPMASTLPENPTDDPASAGAGASTSDPTPVVIELPDAPSHATSVKPRRRTPRPRPSVDPLGHR